MKTIIRTFLKSLLVGATFVIALVIGGMIATLFGFNLPEAEDPAASLMWFFVGGLIAGLSLGPVASSISAARVRHIFVWRSLIFLNIASVAIEGYFFAPSLIGDALPARSAIVRASSVFPEPGEPIINTLWPKNHRISP